MIQNALLLLHTFYIVIVTESYLLNALHQCDILFLSLSQNNIYSVQGYSCLVPR